MTTQIATQDVKPPVKAQVTAGNKLAAFVPTSIDEAWRLAGAIASSGMTPKAYGNDQNKVMVGIIAGAEVGLTPFAALQSIAVINGNPSLWGDGALALVQASGLLEDMEETDDGHTATCRLNRAGRATPIVRTFSMDDAKKAGLAGKAGPWTQYTGRMRQMRARAFAMRDGFSDVLKGLHIAEEVRDYTSMGIAATAQASAPLTASMLIEQSQAPIEVIDQETGEITQAESANDGYGEQIEGDGLPMGAALAEIASAETIVDVNGRLAKMRGKLSPDDFADLTIAAGERIDQLKGL